MSLPLSCPVGRGLWESGASRGRTCHTRRSADGGRQKWRAVLRSGAVSPKRRANAPTRKSKGKRQRAKGKNENRSLIPVVQCLNSGSPRVLTRKISQPTEGDGRESIKIT